MESTADNPSPQAVLAKAGKLFDAISTKEAYDQAVQERGLDAVENEITAALSDICHLMASASDPQLRSEAIFQLIRLLSIKHLEGTIEQKAVNTDGLVAVLVDLLRCEATYVQARAAQTLGMLAVRHAAVVDAGAVQPLVQLLSSSDGDVRNEAIWALGNIAAGTSEQTPAIVDAGGIPPLIQLLSSPDEDGRTAAIGALNNITVASTTCRDAVLVAGVLEPLLTAMRGSGNVTVLEWGCQLLGNLWRVSENSPLPVPLAELAPFVPLLANLVAAPEQDESVVRSALAALADFGRLCMDAAQGTDADRDVLVECGAVASMKALLESADLWKVKAVGCAIVLFITGGYTGSTTPHRQAVIDGGLVPLLVDTAAAASGEAALGLKEMAAQAIGNIAMGSQQQTEYVVECGGVQPLCDLLQAAENLRNIQSTLAVLKEILSAGREKQANEGLPDNPYSTLVEQAGGVDKIVELQTHNDMNIAAQASLFLLNRFPARVDLHRLEALFEAGVIQVGPVHPGGGGDDQATHVGDDNSDGDSDIAGEGNGAVDGHLQGDSGEEER